MDQPGRVIKRYPRSATHEQFHSEIKTDLDLERLPSGKFATNDLILHLAQLAYNILRLMGRLTGGAIRQRRRSAPCYKLVVTPRCRIHKRGAADFFDLGRTSDA